MSGSKADTASLAGRDEDEALVHFILNKLDKDSAEDIVSIDLQGKSAMADHMVIASGRSTRQVSAITEKLTDVLKSERGVLCRTEGKDAGDWVLIDAGDVIVHLFRPEVREFYQLEKMWSPTPETGRMTVGSA
jgi:ribosome-associated protein